MSDKMVCARCKKGELQVVEESDDEDTYLEYVCDNCGYSQHGLEHVVYLDEDGEEKRMGE